MSWIIQGAQSKWVVVIGLEIHAQVKTKHKLFSNAKVELGAEPNVNVSFIDAAMPGMLPVLNQEVVSQAVKMGLAINGDINTYSVFDRKHYFYPDLPQGYQITQFYHPIINNGYVNINYKNNEKKIRIKEIHLEQDAGKSIHDQSFDYSYIDLNRAGVPLMEIVTEPDMSSDEEVVAFIHKLRKILQYTNVCDADMENGSMRCDANVSVMPLNSDEFGTRCEIKNLNSIKSISAAIQYEAQRHIEIIENNGEVQQETRLFDPDNQITVFMRSKESAADYRYFADPDLLPLVLTQSFIDNIKKQLPELPEEKKKRYINMRLAEHEADILLENKNAALYFEKVAENSNPKIAINWIIVELFGRLNKAGVNIQDSLVRPESLAELINLIENKTISGKIAKHVFDVMFDTGNSPKNILEKENLTQINDESEILKIIDNILAEHESKVRDYVNGKTKLFGFFVGQVMRFTNGKANPEITNKLLQNKLKIK